MSSSHGITINVPSTLGAVSIGVAVPDGCSPQKRTFGLNAGYKSADRVAIEGSVDGGASFTPVFPAGSNIPVVLTFNAPQVTLDNGCSYYRAVRSAKDAASTLSTMGGEFTEDTGGGSSGLYGDGSDGDVTVSTTVTLTRPMFYNTLTVTAEGEIITAGYPIFAKTAINSSGIISCKGGNASTFTGGIASAANYGLDGGAGGLGGANGSPGEAASTLWLSHAGGAGGAGISNAGGAPSSGPSLPPTRSELLLALETVRAHGGGGGGGGGDATSGRGGGGGAGGGPVMLVSPEINIAGVIGVQGGSGASGLATNSGGGGGGAGGDIFYVGESITKGSENVARGTGGTAGGVGGVAGSLGAAGSSVTILVS